MRIQPAAPWRLLLLLLSTYVAVPVPALADAAGQFLIGVGRADVTGPPADLKMMGYAEAKQEAAGLEQRLWARAFVVKDESSDQLVAFVNTDIWGPSLILQQTILSNLAAKYGDKRFNEDNVVIHCIHTHQGPGGYQGWVLYDFVNMGFSMENLHRIADGVVAAIVEAESHLQPGSIFIGNATTEEGYIQRNRSPVAFMRNPEWKDAETKPPKVNTQMTSLKFVQKDGTEIGSLNFFPVHPTSYSKANLLVSGDNKGYAEWLLERDKEGVKRETMGASSAASHATYVGAFAQADAGDVSPNLYVSDSKPDELVGEGGARDRVAMHTAGRHQFELAQKALAAATEKFSGPVLGKVEYVNFADTKLSDGSSTCVACVGQSMYAGTADGRGIDFVKEGDLSKAAATKSAFLRVVNTLATGKMVPSDLKKCQSPKLVVLAPGRVGYAHDYTFTPSILPVQVLRLGQLAIAAVPFEVTTMAGRRLRRTILDAMSAHGVSHVELACLSNQYAGYMTTKEEYQAQYYEGSSTLFGPNQLQAAQLKFHDVAEAVAALSVNKIPAAALDATTRPPAMKLSDMISGLISEHGDDVHPISKPFATVLTQPQETKRKNTAEAVFIGTHPSNNMGELKWYCLVEKQHGNTWTVVMDDDHPDTQFQWRRVTNTVMSQPKHTCRWLVAEDAVLGTYRFRAQGFAKKVKGGKPEYARWEGASDPFIVVA